MIKSIEVHGSDTCPHIMLDSEKHVFEIIGISTPSNGKEFYDPIISWVEAYAQQPNKQTLFTFHLEAFNIYSAKMILFILYSLKKISDNGNDVKVMWYYDEDGDEIYESGKDYEIMVQVPFEFMKVTKDKR